MAWSDQRLAGATGVYQAWSDRCVKSRGLATMFDTKHDCTDLHAALDPPFGHDENARSGGLRLLERSLSIGLTAASRLGLLRWDGRFRVRAAVADAAWDLVEQSDKVATEGGGV